MTWICVVCATLLTVPVHAQPDVSRPAAAPKAPAQPDAPVSSSGQSETIEGRVVGLEEGALVVDIGARAGAAADQVAELWRPLRIRHPVTRRIIEDRYRTGSVRITEALEVVSFARVEGEPRRPAAPGDIVVLRVSRRPTPQVTASAPGLSSRPTVVSDTDAAEIAALYDSLRGVSLDQRAVELRAWLEKNKTNRFAAAIDEELVLLEKVLSASSPQAAPTQATQAPPHPQPRGSLRFVPPHRAFAGAPLDISAELEGPIRGAVLHTRHSEEVAYVSIPMRFAGPNFWVATVPSERVRAPRLEYFIEAVRADGTAVPVVASVDAPHKLRVDDRPTPAPPLRHRSIVSIYTDYADYNRLKGNDRVWQTEGFFGMRFTDVGMRALRTGFGVYRGVGGSIDELDVEGAEPRSVGLTYGYLEGEAGVSHTFSLIGRLALGLGDEGLTGGGQVHLRIGNDLETNLLVGGELLGGIGLRGVAQLELAPQGRLPVVLRTEVTNQPAGVATESSAVGVSTDKSEVGGRAIVQVGYRVLDPLVLFGRISYEGRTIVHAGPGFGGGASLEW